MRRGLLALLACATVDAQTPQKLTLADAEAIAVRNHPRFAAARLVAEATRETTRQTKAALSPVLVGNVTGSVAEHNTRIGAGALNPSSLFSRTAAGISISQVLYDFGRVRALATAAESRAASLAETANAVRAGILLRVREAYFGLLLAQSQLRALKENVASRNLTFKQVSALAQSNLRSTLDVSFAELNLAEAELAFDRAGNDVQAGEVDLGAALGYPDGRRFELSDEPDPPPLDATADSMVALAVGGRPELTALRLQVKSAQSFAESERRQSMPTLAAAGVGGIYGPRDERLHPHYGAVGVNLNIPLFNGGLFSSRQREAELRAEAASQELRDLEIRISRDVRAAWVDADNAGRRLSLTAKVLQQALRTLKLAQTRYDLGLSNIIELSQAQLSRTSAEVAAAAARYDYLLKRSVLDYQTGNLR